MKFHLPAISDSKSERVLRRDWKFRWNIKAEYRPTLNDEMSLRVPLTRRIGIIPEYSLGYLIYTHGLNNSAIIEIISTRYPRVINFMTLSQRAVRASESRRRCVTATCVSLFAATRWKFIFTPSNVSSDNFTCARANNRFYSRVSRESTSNF